MGLRGGWGDGDRLSGPSSSKSSMETRGGLRRCGSGRGSGLTSSLRRRGGQQPFPRSSPRAVAPAPPTPRASPAPPLSTPPGTPHRGACSTAFSPAEACPLAISRALGSCPGCEARVSTLYGLQGRRSLVRPRQVRSGVAGARARCEARSRWAGMERPPTRTGERGGQSPKGSARAFSEQRVGGAPGT